VSRDALPSELTVPTFDSSHAGRQNDRVDDTGVDLATLKVSGLALEGETLWLTSMRDQLVARVDTDLGTASAVVRFPHPVADVAPAAVGLWIVAGGGENGRQCVLWSRDQGTAIARFDCPGGAGGGLALGGDRLWLTHRHSRRLLVLDPATGAVERSIATEHEIFSPSFVDGALWVAEAKTGLFGRFSPQSESIYFFTPLDPERGTACERLAAPVPPAAMTTDGRRFWYAPRAGLGVVATTRAALVPAP